MNAGLIKHVALSALLLACAAQANAAPLTIELPAETVKLRPSQAPGYNLAQQKCGICHSADYIEYQPPGFDRTHWTALVRKMKDSYGAPVSDTDVEVIGEYLAGAYSGAPATAMQPQTSVLPATDKPVNDVQALLDQNACLACHAIDHKVVGPAYRDVAKRYKNDGQAVAKLIEHISQGGSGRWGEVPMPAFAGLSSQALEQLAEFVLRQ
ncbi:c-type cytochrome [Pseudomonas sp. B21-035]|uniref:SorB family sulfite dehydrogenase c-type cytochrome subunit n=1 Tax=Pseudomonas sp. B21-035 TaxID=2895484 RepID=UPI00216041D0|nr:c-type cytochrome [Pseudomonas sp. B21-035]UVL58833.1 c-type cytochrome [Pseudomonas sp. B21-035]